MKTKPEEATQPNQPSLCIHCHKTLANFHGAFARCAGGKTQFVPAAKPNQAGLTEQSEVMGCHNRIDLLRSDFNALLDELIDKGVIDECRK